MFALSLSLAACFGWGIADFLGGLKSRHLPTITVLTVSNIFGVAMIFALVCLRGTPLPDDPALWWAVAGGMTGIIAMFLLYKALAIGPMSIIAPISSLGAILPLAVGLTTGDELSTLQCMGIPTAIAGTLLAVREKGEKKKRTTRSKGVWMALASAVAVGCFLIVMDRASAVDPYWSALIMRSSYGVFLTPFVFVLRPPLNVGRLHLPGIITLGVVDALAGFAFAMATTVGMLSLVAVVGSLYPAVTILLSSVLLRERLLPTQYVGVSLALAGVVLISL
ncbi:membrane protein [Desulfoluna limicola]|uniref:Membrane protein n=1 Tax=Desulfoluna limicola TaxID=2810562 RepID=A0ABM7PJ29_9BACT|nr:DMT family transporter [Desulfoluna limicola]BCS97193.1 membrane protein [Desulfoluna limicola]